MPPEQRMADYLAGALPDRERADLEAELAAHPEALRELVEQRRLDAALGALLGARSERIEAAIMASVHGVAHEEVEARVLEATVFAPPTQAWRRAYEATDSLRNRSGNLNLSEDPSPGFATLSPSDGERDGVRGRGSWAALCGWFRVRPRWRWVGVAVAAVLVGLSTVSFWSASRLGQRSQPGLELAGADRESELVRELAPLVAALPVWTGSEQQSAWLTALAAVTASGGNER